MSRTVSNHVNSVMDPHASQRAKAQFDQTTSDGSESESE